jgi:iron complex outermembrane recepter protein
MIKIYSLLLLLVAAPAICLAQKGSDTLKRDTSKRLTGATVTGYLIEQPVLSVPAAVSI